MQTRRASIITYSLLGFLLAANLASAAGLLEPPSFLPGMRHPADSLWPIALLYCGYLLASFSAKFRRRRRGEACPGVRRAPLSLKLSAVYEQDGEWINATLPAVPGVVACANSKHEARAMLADALRETLLSHDATNRPADADPDDVLVLTLS